jgi:hypothetical protein
MNGRATTNPVVLMLFGLFILYGFGYETLGARLWTELEGVVISSRDNPASRGPRYATEYTIRVPDGRESTYIAGATDATLERNLPVGTYVRKRRWRVDYEINGQRVKDFGILFYGFMVCLGIGCIVWSAVISYRRRSKT